MGFLDSVRQANEIKSSLSPMSTGMSSTTSPMMGQDKSNFDSTTANYGSGQFAYQPHSYSGNTGINGGASIPQPANPNQTDGTALGTIGSTDWLRNYTDPRGTGKKLTDSSVNYWNQKWNEWGSKDPAFYQKFLGNAEEFTGGSKETAQAMGWDNGQGNQQGQIQGNGFLGQLLPQLMQMLKGGGAQRRNNQIPQQQMSNGNLFGNVGQSMDISSFL
jgi:hypothetical protein